METVSVTLPESIKQYVEDQVAKGGYGSVSDYMRHLVETDQREQARAALESEVLKGLDSGESTPMTAGDWQQIREEVRSRHAVRK
jgi:antitoxin ParD1/3/4